MKTHATEFVKQYLHALNAKAGEKFPRPFGETVHGEVMHSDFLYVGESSSLGESESDERDGFRHVLVMMDDLGSFV